MRCSDEILVETVSFLRAEVVLMQTRLDSYLSLLDIDPDRKSLVQYISDVKKQIEGLKKNLTDMEKGISSIKIDSFPREKIHRFTI